ncbi:metal-sulfur cluster assembly factor [Candidatus Palauibacter sp.]|uniref:metal-sulfur cluster assembly factor n=1 Tax=Candidatus Palauibacter sp. TaxID=3101350 RepID=UPI003B5A2013
MNAEGPASSVALPRPVTRSRPRSLPRYEAGMDFGAVLRETQGGRDLPPPPAFAEPAADLAERARRALYEVADPEFPISIVDLGLVRGIEGDEEAGSVTVHLTFTATACPCMDFIQWDVRERLLELDGVRQVEIVTEWDPPWTTAAISARGRKLLRSVGVVT